MRFITWEQPTRRLTPAGVANFYESPLTTPTIFKFKTRRLDVPSHGGAFSLKTVLSGEEVYQLGQRTVWVRPGQFLFTNAGETYSSHIQSETESVSIFVPEAERDSVMSSVTMPARLQLDDVGAATGPREVPQIAFAGATRTAPALRRLMRALDASDDIETLDCMRRLLAETIETQLGLAPSSGFQHFRKRSTRDELLQRLVRAKSHILDTSGQLADLDELARIACLSKYYFLRLFTEAFGESPSAFARRLRLERAVQALMRGAPQSRAARQAGYTDLRAFRRACRRMLRVEISKIAKPNHSS